MVISIIRIILRMSTFVLEDLPCLRHQLIFLIIWGHPTEFPSVMCLSLLLFLLIIFLHPTSIIFDPYLLGTPPNAMETDQAGTSDVRHLFQEARTLQKKAAHHVENYSYNIEKQTTSKGLRIKLHLSDIRPSRSLHLK